MTYQQTEVTSSSVLPDQSQQHTYQEQLAERIAAKHVVEAKQRGIPLWMLTGFPALSNEPDQDDPCDFQ